MFCLLCIFIKHKFTLYFYLQKKYELFYLGVLQERGLYYDGHNGTYYYFDELTKSFQFHSQVTQQSITSPIEESNRKRKQDSPVELAKVSTSHPHGATAVKFIGCT